MKRPTIDDRYFVPLEIVESITGKVKANAMCRALARMKIPHMPNGNGWPLVPRAAIEPQLGAVATTTDGPDLAALAVAFAGKRRSA